MVGTPADINLASELLDQGRIISHLLFFCVGGLVLLLEAHRVNTNTFQRIEDGLVLLGQADWKFRG